MCLKTTLYGPEPNTFLWILFYRSVPVYQFLPENMFPISMHFYEIWRGKQESEKECTVLPTPVAREEGPKNIYVN